MTGANFLLEIDGQKILVDCGLTQGMKLADDVNWDSFVYDPREIDILFVTHAHVDHLGRIPKLINEGFRGKIFSTLPTKGLALPMLEDTMSILSKNTDLGLEKIYTEENIKLTLSLWQGFEYHTFKCFLMAKLELATLKITPKKICKSIISQALLRND